MERLIFALTFLSILGTGLVAGIFFAFSVFVMRALGRLPPTGGIAAMQSINVAVLNPVFFAAFFGTAVLSLALAVAALVGWSLPYLLAGSLLYLVGTILVTIVFNVPLNNRLASVTPDSAEARWRLDALSLDLDCLESCADGHVPCRRRLFIMALREL